MPAVYAPSAPGQFGDGRQEDQRDENEAGARGNRCTCLSTLGAHAGTLASRRPQCEYSGFGRGPTSIVICSYASVDLERVRFARLRLPYPFVSW